MPGVEAVERNQGVRANSAETDAVDALISAARRAMLEFSREINALRPEPYRRGGDRAGLVDLPARQCAVGSRKSPWK